VRPAGPEDADAVAHLSYATSPETWDRFLGNREHALSVIRRAFHDTRTDLNRQTVLVAELDGEPAGALACFPVEEGWRRGNALLRLALSRTAPWRWPAMLHFFWFARKASPPPPPASLYVDALATEERFRRRGVATALLEAAERRAGDLGLRLISLDTEVPNAPARSLYRGAGFSEDGETAPKHGFPGYVLYVKRLDSS
jgi:ribosomal protein S18 acetylase RimI-like enzyme